MQAGTSFQYLGRRVVPQLKRLKMAAGRMGAIPATVLRVGAN